MLTIVSLRLSILNVQIVYALYKTLKYYDTVGLHLVVQKSFQLVFWNVTLEGIIRPIFIHNNILEWQFDSFLLFM